MKIKRFNENIKKTDTDFDQNFKVGDIVICIDDSRVYGKERFLGCNNEILKNYRKYKVVQKHGDRLITIKDLITKKKNMWNITRFIHERNLDEWLMYNDIINFNL